VAAVNKPRLAKLAATGWWSAAARAYESRRDDRLFDDPWATLLLGQQANVLLPQSGLAADSRAAYELYAVVTRFFDDYLLRVTSELGVRQVVLLASGLDTRAYRLGWPSRTTLFELEQPHVLTYKDIQLDCAGVPASCRRHPVGVDLTAGWDAALRAAGFDASLPSAWLLEGFLYFLAKPDVVDLLNRVSELATTGSWIGLDVVNKAMLTSTWTRHWNDRMTAGDVPWLFTEDDPVALLERFGWRAQATQPGIGAAGYGRRPYDAAAGTDGSPRSFLVTATR
jgi:methyltransferase (TIGR00027 family)